MAETFEGKNKFASFIEEIRELQRQEQSGEVGSIHFLPIGDPGEEFHFAPEELQEADMDMWEEIKRWESEGLETEEKSRVAKGKFMEYKDRVAAEEGAEERESWNTSSRLVFVGMMSNHISPILNQYLMAELNK